MLREIVLDTETTGLDPTQGDRIVEIGALELVNRFPSGREWHHYFDPERDMPQAAFEVHGISAEFLKGKPKFAELADDFVEFVGDAPLVIHNASFDIKFLNAELARSGHGLLTSERAVDTLAMARRKHPGAPATLDALCKRYGIDTTVRTKHGALIDCKLLADVYVEMLGEKQARLVLAGAGAGPVVPSVGGLRQMRAKAMQRPEPLAPRLAPEELAAHKAFVDQLGSKAIWHEWLTAGA
jgi:DNA polymerase-3 subunit epsilon